MLDYLLPALLILAFLTAAGIAIWAVRKALRRADEHVDQFLEEVHRSVLLREKKWTDLTDEELEQWGEAMKSQGERLLSKIRR